MPCATKKEFERLVVSVAANRIPIDYEHDAPTMKEMCDSLEKYGVNYRLIGTKLHFERKEKRGWWRASKTYQYTASFAGWTRTVGAETARKILSNLNLYNEFANYRDFFEGKEAMYQLVNDFNGPLRRLKDK